MTYIYLYTIDSYVYFRHLRNTRVTSGTKPKSNRQKIRFTNNSHLVKLHLVVYYRKLVVIDRIHLHTDMQVPTYYYSTTVVRQTQYQNMKYIISTSGALITICGSEVGFFYII